MKREGVVLSKLELQKRLNVISRMSEWVLANTRAKWVHEVTSEVAWAYSCAIGERDVTVKTRNNEIGHLRTVWKMLEKHGKVEDNPWGLARAQRDRSEETHGRAFTDDEVSRILNAAREVGCEWEGMVTVALYTGLRKGDIEHLKWEGDPEKEVIADMNVRRIYGTPSKTARKRVRIDIPMHDKVYDLLSKMERGEYIFPWRLSHPNGQRPKEGDYFFSEVLKRAEIVVGKGEKVSFHSLRHTFVTRLADAGVAEDVRMRLAGHTNAVTHGVYTHEDSQSKAAIGALK
jgi:integrase